MEKLDKTINAIMRLILAIAMLALLVGGTWQIVSNLMGSPSTFTNEFLRYVLIWASMLGSAYCFYKDEHLALDLVRDRVHGKAAIILTVFVEAMVLFFVCYVFVYGGYQLVVKAKNVSSVMKIPYTYLYLIIPVSGAFIVLARILRYIQLFLNKKGGNA